MVCLAGGLEEGSAQRRRASERAAWGLALWAGTRVLALVPERLAARLASSGTGPFPCR